MQTATIQAGVAQSPEHAAHATYWPVVETRPLPLANATLTPAKPSILVFTSRNAVEVFSSNVALMDQLQKNKACVQALAAVGSQTAKSLQANLASELDPAILKIITPDAASGLEPLLRQVMATALHPLPSIFVFTAKDGASRAIVKKLIEADPSLADTIHVTELYELIATSSLPPEVETVLRRMTTDKNFEVVIECQSGRIVESVLAHLVQFFGCTSAVQLPVTVRFSTRHLSARQMLEQHGLAQRLREG